MVAAGAAYCVVAVLEVIRGGLRSFTSSYYSAPGRMNMTEVKGIKVIVDYCHNAPAMIALGAFVDRFFEDTASWERPQRIGVIATAGDRRDQDMIDLGLEAAKHFDRIIGRAAAWAKFLAGWADPRAKGGCVAGRPARPPR